VRNGIVQVEGQIERRSLVPVLERLVVSVEGVVGTDEHLSWLLDDTVGGELAVPWTAVGRR
jgi:hypothetical protein